VSFVPHTPISFIDPAGACDPAPREIRVSKEEAQNAREAGHAPMKNLGKAEALAAVDGPAAPAPCKEPARWLSARFIPGTARSMQAFDHVDQEQRAVFAAADASSCALI
jgi:hypothetical protein